MIDKAGANEVGHRVAAHKVGFVEVHLLTYQLLDFIVLNVSLDKMNPIYWRHIQKINSNDGLVSFL